MSYGSYEKDKERQGNSSWKIWYVIPCSAPASTLNRKELYPQQNQTNDKDV